MKMHSVKKHLVLVLAVLMAFSMVACNSASPVATTAASAIAAPTTAAASATVAATTAAFDPLAKYDKPITLTCVKRTTQGVKFNDNMSEADNYWTRFLADKGINIQYLWTADASEYDNKMNMTIASGEVPDLFYQLSAVQANTLISGGMLQDMKPALDKYMTPLLKKYLIDADNGQSMNGLVQDGKQMLLPSGPAEIRNDSSALWIRKDWLKNVGLSAPNSLDDFLKICDAFVNQDPDKDGQNDTYAFGVAGKDNLITDWGGLAGFFDMFHVQPEVWYDGSLFYEKDSTGQIIWSGSKPAMKTALQTLAEMYTKGYLSKDFATADSGGKLAQDITNSKCGMFFGKWWNGLWPLPDLFAKTPTADWTIVRFPSADGQPVTPAGFLPGNVYKAVSANCKNPEAVVKIMDYYVEAKYGPNPDPNLTGNDSNDQGKNSLNCPYQVNDPAQNNNDYAAILNAINTKSDTGLNASQEQIYKDIQTYLADPTNPKNGTGWGDYITYGPSGSGNYFFVQTKPSDILDNAWFKFPTTLMATKSATYKDLASQAIIKIIYGEEPVSYWDTVVQQWMTAGGSDILKEVNAQASK